MLIGCSMINGLRRIATHPLLVQAEFEKFDQARIDSLQEIYNKIAAVDYRTHLTDQQQLHGLDLASGPGRGYGYWPPLTRYLSVLVTRKSEHVIKNRLCDACSYAVVTSQVNSCAHVLCATCMNDTKAMRFCIICGKPADEIRVADATGILESINGSVSQAKLKESQRDSSKDWLRLPGVPMPSTKTIALKLQILDWLEEQPDAKIIVFTQFRDM